MTARAVVATVLGGAAVLAPLGLALASWPEWWRLIAPEQTPMTWLESIVLMFCAAAALALWYLQRMAGLPRGTWLILSAGFAGLAIDERFALHERIRDGFLAPRGIALPFLPWIGPGDFLLLIIAGAGIALLPLVWSAMAPDRGARRTLLLGVALAAIAVVMDSFDPGRFTLEMERLEQTIEEVVELAAGIALLIALLLRLMTAVDELSRRDTPPAFTTHSAPRS